MITRSLCALALVGGLWACNNGPNTPQEPATTLTESPQEELVYPPPPNPNTYVAQIEKAHQKPLLINKKAVKFDIVLSFGGKERLNGTITALSNSTQARIDYTDGRTIIYKDNTVYAPEPMAEPDKKGSTRFNAYTWPYFFLFPYKLSDPGSAWSEFDPEELNGHNYSARKLSFMTGTGDNPNDWYITYVDRENHLLQVAAYIVTAGKTQEEAEKNPHAIRYEDYQEIEGIPIAHQWTFWNWNEDQGLTDQLGEATIDNVQFFKPTKETFAIPEGFATL